MQRPRDPASVRWRQHGEHAVSKTRGLGIWVFAAAVTAAAIGPSSARQGAAAAAGADKVAPAPASSIQPHEDSLDTLDTIAESLALDTSSEGLRRRAGFSLRLLRAPGPMVTEQQNLAIVYFKALFDLPLRPGRGLPEAKEAVKVLARAYARGATPAAATSDIAAATASIDAFLGDYFDSFALTDKNASKEAVLRARDFDQIDKDPLKIALLGQVAADRGSHIEFLIATLPDPIDSYTGWQFDPMLDAIAQAVAKSAYILDRSHFPDSDKEAGATDRGDGRLHELEPGVVVFRKHASVLTSDEGTIGDRLVLLLVHENPAAGIHVRALANAIRLVARCAPLARRTPADPPQPAPIRILGPTFSGSSESLARALQLADQRLAQPIAVRVVTGSATDPQNLATIENASSSPDQLTVAFAATVNPDTELLPRIIGELGKVGWLQRSNRVAVLFESNTQYGREMGDLLYYGQNSGRSPISMISLPFPMNISRLRTNVQASDAGRSGLLGLPSPFRHLDLEAKGNPTDLIPQFTPNTSAVYSELGLAGLLQTISREHVSTVGLMATDARDKLFLAQELARYAPDVSIFTAESDSLYTHPDYSSFLRGALVASTYPLHGGNQRWSYGFQGGSEARQFANGSAQGIYNAALALLAYDEHGNPLSDDPPRLVEYSYPGDPCETQCRPPVWISVVGSSTAWPIREYHDVGPSRYVFPVNAPVHRQFPALFPSTSFHVLLYLLTAALIAGVIVQARNGVQLFAGPEVQPDTEALPPGLGYLLAGLLTLLTVQGFLVVLCLLRLRAHDRTPAAIAALATGMAGLVAVVVMTFRVAAAVAAGGAAFTRDFSWRRRSTWAGGVTAVAVAWCAWNLGAYLLAHTGDDLGATLGFLSRAFEFGNGVSPTVPVLFLAGALGVWALTEVSRVRRGRVALADATVQPVLQELVYAPLRSLNESWALLNRSLISVPRVGLGLVTVTTAATCIFAFNPLNGWLVSTEGPQFGRFVSIALLLVQTMVALGLVQFAFVWRGVKGFLDLMAHHPLGEACGRVPRDLFPATILPTAPHLADLQSAVAQADRIRAEADGASAACVTAVFERDMRDAPGQHWAASASWNGLLNAASLSALAIRNGSLPTAAGPPMQIPASPSPSPSGTATVVTQTVSAARRQAEIPAMVAALVIRDALARLAHNLVFVVGGILCVFGSYTLFPFQQRTQLAVLGWIYIGIAFATILTVLVQMNRNPVIARLSSPTAEAKSTWDTDFVLKITIFALLPLFTLFAAQFPDIGGVILRWIEPVQKVLP